MVYKENKNVAKGLPLFSWVFAVLGALLSILSLVPFSAAITWLSRLEADGTFDSLTVGEYKQFVLILRIAAILCLALAVVWYLWHDKISPILFPKRSLSIRDNYNQLFHDGFNWQEESVYLIGLLGVTVLGIIARLLLLERPVGYDEAYTFIHFASRDLRYIVTDYSGPNNHIFHSILVSFVYRLAGTHLWALRLPAFLAGVLCIPAAFLAGKKLFHPLAGLIGAVGISLMPVLIDYSNNARGYTLVCFFALAGIWLATDIVKQDHLGSWLLFSGANILGFYTIPTYLYPFSVMYLWLLLAGSYQRQNRSERISFIIRWLFWGFLSGFVVLILYSPVLIFGTGLASITGNEFVQSLSWHDFRKTLINRMPIVWNDWWFQIPGWIMVSSIVGFALSIPALFSQKTHHQRLHLILPAVISIGGLLFAQRVVPLARVWMFLLAYYLVYSGIGFAWLILALQKRFVSTRHTGWAATAVLLILTTVGVIIRAQNPKYSLVEPGFDYSAARYLSQNLGEGDRIFVVSPASMRVGYYLYQMELPLDLLYDRDRPSVVNQGYVVVIEKSKYGTPESVLEFLHLNDHFTHSSPELVFKEKRMEIYHVETEP